MKRYWKIALLVPFILVCIGFYYLNTGKGIFPNYYLKLQAGDQQEAFPISIQARYTDQSLTIRSEGSEYQSDLSLLESLAYSQYRSPEREKLQKEHRQFMRGKNNLAAIYQDENTLGYVDIEAKRNSLDKKTDYQFNVSIYNKRTKSSSSFKMKIPMEGNYPIMNTTDVQIVGQTLKIISINSKNVGITQAYNTQPEVHLYTLDLSKKIIESDKVLLSGISEDSNSTLDIQAVFQTDPTVKNDYAVFQKRYTREEKDVNSNPFDKVYKKEIVYYDYRSDELKVVQNEALAAVLQKEDYPNIWFIKEDLWINDRSDPKKVRVLRYNLTENKWGKELIIDTKNVQANGELRDSLMTSDRLYLQGNIKLDASRAAPGLLIADLENGKILYEGYIARKDNQSIRNFMLERVYLE